MFATITKRLPTRVIRTTPILVRGPIVRNFSNESKQTHFGFQTISEEEKQKRVNQVFHNVADKYDLMNDLMSGYIHRIWKDMMVNRLDPKPGNVYLDVAGGTGDIAFRIAKKIDEHPNSANVPSKVIVADINASMLEVGKSRWEKMKNRPKNVELSWIEQNAEILDKIEDNSVDAYTIVFGIRNFTHIDKALQQAYRVLKPGGQFMCMEFSKVHNPILSTLYDIYSFNVIPCIGEVVTKDRASYQYLVESIRKFPDQEEFKKMIEDAGFKYVRYLNYTFGVAAVHFGFKV